MELGASGEGLPVDTVIKVFPVPGTVPDIDKALIEISPTRRHHRSTGISGILGDDVDYAVDGVCSPDGAARASDHFDSFDVLKHGVLDLPVDAGEQRGVNAPAVDKYEYGSGEGTLESADTERPGVRV